jgi:murein DD-endopeptidase MepM/ murein hydrolase activator NlpD
VRALLSICALLCALAPSAGAQPTDLVPSLPPDIVHPVDGPVGYGEWAARFGNFRHGHVHAGQDVFAPSGTTLVAVRDAIVVDKGSGDGRGNYVSLFSREENETYVYFHMLGAAPVDVGDRIALGDRVGRIGCTGSCYGDHLHFEVRRGRGSYGRPRDPLPLLRSAARP